MKHLLYRLKYGPYLNVKKHLFDIHFYSLQAYNDFHEKRLCKILMRLGLYTGSFNSPIGIFLWLSSSKDFNDAELNRMYSSTNLKVLAGKCKAHLFQKAKGYGSKIGRFIGILVTQEDYYYILMDDKGNKWYESCVGKIEFLKD